MSLKELPHGSTKHTEITEGAPALRGRLCPKDKILHNLISGYYKALTQKGILPEHIPADIVFVLKDMPYLLPLNYW